MKPSSAMLPYPADDNANDSETEPESNSGEEEEIESSCPYEYGIDYKTFAYELDFLPVALTASPHPSETAQEDASMPLSETSTLLDVELDPAETAHPGAKDNEVAASTPFKTPKKPRSSFGLKRRVHKSPGGRGYYLSCSGKILRFSKQTDPVLQTPLADPDRIQKKELALQDAMRLQEHINDLEIQLMEARREKLKALSRAYSFV